jgi:hypothetical protein
LVVFPQGKFETNKVATWFHQFGHPVCPSFPSLWKECTKKLSEIKSAVNVFSWTSCCSYSVIVYQIKAICSTEGIGLPVLREKIALDKVELTPIKILCRAFDTES